MGEIITSTQAGAFVADGAYVYEAPNGPNIPQGPATNVVAVAGGASDGPVAIPTPVNTGNGSGPLLAAFGTDTLSTHALVRSALSAMPECSQFLVVRATDGTDTPAVITFLDDSAGTVFTLTAITGGPNNHTGTTGNGATAQLTYQSQNISGGGVVSLAIQWPNNVAEVFQGIATYATLGGAYNKAAFLANLEAAVNTGNSQHAKSQFVVAAGGSSSLAPVAGVSYTGAGGTNGTGSLTDDDIIGEPSAVGAATGMYAFQPGSFGVLVLAGCTNPSDPSVVAAFLAQTGGMGTYAFPSGTPTDTAISTIQGNGIANRRIIPCIDWDYVNDVLSGNSNLLVDPQGKIAGIIASLPAYLSPSNKPYTGALGVLGTERTIGQPVNPYGEGATRQANGIMWLTNQMPRGGNLFGLPHGQASDGSNICDTRMLDVIALAVLQIMGLSVGEMQTPPPAPGAQDRDATRLATVGRLNAYFQTLLNPAQPQIVSAQVAFTGTLVQVDQGFLPYSISVTTLSAVKYALASLLVGNALSIWTPTTSG